MQYKLVNEDCLIGMKQLDNESIDMVVTSPPYDNLRKCNGFTFDFEKIANELFRIIKKGGVVVWIVSDATINGSETGTSFRQALYFMEVGFNLHDTMIWKKDCLSFPDTKRYGQNFEYMFILSKGSPKTVNKIKDRKNKWYGAKIHGTSRNADGDTFRKPNDKKNNVREYGERFNVWEIPGEKHNTTGHPAVFPRAIARDHILSWSNKGDTVLDIFSGSGTTAIEAINNGRKFIGFEISEEYYRNSIQRIREETSQMTIFNL